MGAIRKAEQARFAYLLNVLVSSLPPPTRPVDCMNYSSICNKQLGNYYCHNQINNSPCDVATTWQNLFTYPRQGRIYGLGVARLSSSVFFFFLILLFWCYAVSPPLLLFSCLSLLQPSSFLPLLCPSQGHSWKESCYGGESAGLPARLPCDHSPLLCVSLSFATLSFWSSLGGDKFTPSVWLDLYILCVCVCVEV